MKSVACAGNEPSGCACGRTPSRDAPASTARRPHVLQGHVRFSEGRLSQLWVSLTGSSSVTSRAQVGACYTVEIGVFGAMHLDDGQPVGRVWRAPLLSSLSLLTNHTQNSLAQGFKLPMFDGTWALYTVPQVRRGDIRCQCETFRRTVRSPSTSSTCAAAAPVALG
jgi:hypothetical protein